ncbi:hypothetical protein AFB00_08845 [Pseudonocardia sp. HH130630-07]|nr:hypothetical protein AFB00_08845 [Pseudonocardia sp. HH130630-07]
MPEHPQPTSPGLGSGSEGPVLAGLAREVDALRRAVGELEPVPEQVADLARLVGQLSEALAALTARRRVPAAPSWLLAPADPGHVQKLLDELCGWLEAVYLRYPDAAGSLPPCWLWHPDVVEELLWLMHAWLAAYQGPAASVGAAGDWHDRQRPGVVARIGRQAKSCSVEKHQTRAGWASPPSGPVAVPGRDAIASMARWWALDRDGAAPEPAAADTASGSGERKWSA